MNFLQQIKQAYRNPAGNPNEPFQTVLSAADEIGLDAALELLEQCVIEKRQEWLDQNLISIERSGDPLEDAYRAFYEQYLGVSIPEGGEMVEKDGCKLVMRWWNACPTLETCKALGLDTREICKKVYHKPVQEFLRRIDPHLRFDRNYDALRPYTPYCEEMIILGE